MHPAPFPSWLRPLFPLLFLTLWLGVVTALNLMAGHRQLLGRFPPVDDSIDPAFHFASGSIRGVRFDGALYVGIGRRGLHLAPNWLFRTPFLRAIPCIPWQELVLVEAPRATGSGQLGGTKFEVVPLKLSVVLYGPPAHAIEQRLAESAARPTR